MRADNHAAAIQMLRLHGFTATADALQAIVSDEPRKWTGLRLMTRAEYRKIFCVYCDAELDQDIKHCARCKEVGDVYEERA